MPRILVLKVCLPLRATSQMIVSNLRGYDHNLTASPDQGCSTHLCYEKALEVSSLRLKTIPRARVYVVCCHQPETLLSSLRAQDLSVLVIAFFDVLPANAGHDNNHGKLGERILCQIPRTPVKDFFIPLPTSLLKL